MYLTTEQREVGKLNFLSALGTIRGDFLKKSLTAKSIGSHYFGYGSVDKPVKAGIVGTGNEGCDAMIKQSSPDYLEFVAYHDIRPSNIKRAREKAFTAVYGKERAEKVKFYETYKAMLEDKDLEAIVIATPLWTHAQFAIDAMKAGKHVLCEKLMAHNITDSKRMVRTADETKKVLSIGHQRHYSTLYDNALAIIRAGVLGEIRHVRALWHRNNTWESVGVKPGDVKGRTPAYLNDSWAPPVPAEDQSVDFKKYGYKSIEQLIRWRLYNETGGGLMAELGSHQLDACSLFLEKVHPLNVAATGGKYFFEDDRECEDHVFCTYELPSKQDPKKPQVVLTYSTINTNTLEGYGEIVTGSLGTLMIMNERDAMLFKEREKSDPNPSVDQRTMLTKSKEGKTQLAPSPATDLPADAALAKVALDAATNFKPPGDQKEMVNRGYYNEQEAFAFAIRNPNAKVRCDGKTALGDTVMTLATNVAMRTGQRLDFKDSWYDPSSDDVPDSKNGVLAKGY